MATISSPGIGSGLDINSIISKLLAVEKQPIAKLEQEATTLQSQLSTYGQLKSAMSTLRDTAAALTRADTWGQTSGTSSDSSAVAVTTNAQTKPGNYSLEIQKLAAAQSNSTINYPSADSLVGEGTLQIDMGAWSEDQSTFTTTSSVQISVGPPAESLAQLRDKINASNAGVTASVLTDANGARLVFRASSTGAEHGFRITTDDADGNNSDGLGLSALAFDPSAGILTMTQAIAAANASATLNGIPISSATNNLSNVIDGISLTLGKVTTAPVQVTANQDNTAIRKSLDDFVTAYNSLNTLLSDQTKYNAATKTGGALQGDSAAVSMRSQMRALLGSDSGASSMFSRLSEVGFDVQRDGSIKLNETKLKNGLANIGDMQKLFGNTDTLVSGNNGIATRMRNMADQVMSVEGSINTRTDGLRKRIERNNDKQDDLNDRVALVEKRLRAQYTTLDKQMSELTGLSGYVSAQINASKN